MNPGFLLVLSIIIQLGCTGILKQYFPHFVYSSVYPYIQVPLSGMLSIFIPSYFFLKRDGKMYFSDFLEGVQPGVPLLIAFLTGICLQFAGIAANAPLNILIEALNGQTKSVIPTPVSFSGFILSVICFAILPALFEEILFRGILFNYYRQYGKKAAVIISAILFAIMHFSVGNLAGTLVWGFVFGILFACTNRIIYPVMAHFGLNLSACVLTYISKFPMLYNFYKDYYMVFILISFPLLMLLVYYFRITTTEMPYKDEEKLNNTKEYLLNIDGTNSLKVYEHDIRENNTSLALKHLVLSPYFYILTIIFIYLGGSVLW